MQLELLKKKIVIVGMSAIIGFSALGIAPAPFTSKVEAAITYETKVEIGVNLRSQPSTSGKVIRLISKGESINVISKVNSYWLKVSTKDNKTGYISANSKYTNYNGSSSSSGSSQTASSSKADRVISLAQSYKGRVSYDFGTRNPSRLIFDCSSFTEFIFAKVGVDLKWGTQAQKSQGSAVSKSNLRKGDLVFFDTIGSNNRVINHVGIYMGSGKFIHNTPSVDGIAINSLSSGWWSSHYVSARRVL
ncbi:SH3 domain-containing C40 family peptidase [Paenibacillus sp. LHD-38]|uniref:C40 family peptidase n=1 Tax=Paenibacillus sp. LHD-38 TaxID=3072143 RepID=UPI00280DBC78|nr:SH3 domain-containing C40 family peptidase [Paenibacillus sp. LHD-38]MDQ8736611.1 SH3 domain-containing C40 family peptidase [Paenibacillus sp. LHD-38]